MNTKVYKWCAVPQCKNTSIKTPDKVFVHVPYKKTIRDKWLKLARRNPNDVGTNSPIYFCEDHFDLPNDMANYWEYHVMGSVSQVRMKPGCMPKKFICQPNRKMRISDDTKERPYAAKKRRMMILQECEKQIEVSEQSSYEESATCSSVTSRESPQLRVLAPRKVHAPTRKRNDDKADLFHGSCQEPPERQDEDNDSAPMDEDMVEVKDELDDECKIPVPDPLSSGGLAPSSMEDPHSPAEEEPTLLLGEYKIAVPDPLSSGGLAPSSMEDPHSPAEQEPTPLLGELTEVVVKEETEDPPEIELIDYKALYLKNKEELIILENENQRLREENQNLNEKNSNIVNKIEKLLQKHEERIKNLDNDIMIDNNIKNNLKSDSRNITAINSNLAKNIDALVIQNQARVREIQELTKKNTSLSAKIQELSDSNRCLTATIDKLKDINSRKDEEVNVFVQKIKTLSEDVQRLSDDNARLQREIQEVIDKHTMDREDHKPMKRTRKRKRKT